MGKRRESRRYPVSHPSAGGGPPLVLTPFLTALPHEAGKKMPAPTRGPELTKRARPLPSNERTSSCRPRAPRRICSNPPVERYAEGAITAQLATLPSSMMFGERT